MSRNLSDMRGFHSPSDGRGRRRVLVNGNEISHVLWCDAVKGIACFAPKPLRLKRPGRDQVYTRILRGAVVVEPIGVD